MSFGFSPSDFVVFGQFATKVWKALRSDGGSKTEYQTAEQQCRGFLDTIQEIKQLELSTLPDNVQTRIQKHSDDACNLISSFKDVIKKYEKSMGSHSKRSAITSAHSKVRWAFAATEELASFRQSLTSQLDLIKLTMMTTIFSEFCGLEQLQTNRALTRGIVVEGTTSLVESQPTLSSAEDQPAEDVQEGHAQLQSSNRPLDLVLMQSCLRKQQIVVKNSANTVESQRLEEFATEEAKQYSSTKSTPQLKALRETVKLLSRDLSAKHDWNYGYVYVLEERDSAYVKIGFTTFADVRMIKAHMDRCQVRIQSMYLTPAFRGSFRAEKILFKLMEEDEFPRYGCVCHISSEPRHLGTDETPRSHRGWFRKSFEEAKMTVELVCDWMHLQAPYSPTGIDHFSSEQPRDWHASLNPTWAGHLKLWMRTQYTAVPLKWQDFFRQGRASMKNCRLRTPIILELGNHPFDMSSEKIT